MNLEEIIIKVENIVWSTPLTVFLIVVHIYYTFRLKLPQKYTLKGLFLMFRKEEKQGITSFQSLMTILAGTLGVGNIVGVATAIVIGGVGSIFWIFISGILAIATKYAETFIALKYRMKKKGKYIGGAMYVLKNRLDLKKLAILFSIFVVISSFGGTMIQANAMSEMIAMKAGFSKNMIAIIVTIFACYIIFGSERRIAKLSSIIVPIAILIYSYLCIYLGILFQNKIGESIQLIIQQAFEFRAVCGGMFASFAIQAMKSGLSKGLYSNEAGMGSTPLFNVSVESNKTIKEESMIASTSVFIDTVLLCTITGVLMVASDVWKGATSPMQLVSEMFGMVPLGDLLITICIAIFAISTLPCTGYYGTVGIRFLFHDKKIYEIIYEFCYLLCIYYGCLTTIRIVWGISSIFNALMIFPNMIAIFLLRKEIET